jgi:hypothetical protein
VTLVNISGGKRNVCKAKLMNWKQNKNIIDLYRGIEKFKKVYQSRNNFVKNENGCLLTYSHGVLNR